MEEELFERWLWYQQKFVGKYISRGENIKQRLQTQLPERSSSSQSWMNAGCNVIGNGGDCGQLKRVCPIKQINHFSGSVACYLDLLLFQEKLEILIIAIGLDKTTTAITSCDPKPSQSSLQTVICIKMQREKDASQAWEWALLEWVWTCLVVSRGIGGDRAGSPKTLRMGGGLHLTLWAERSLW